MTVYFFHSEQNRKKKIKVPHASDVIGLWIIEEYFFFIQWISTNFIRKYKFKGAVVDDVFIILFYVFYHHSSLT